MQAEGTGVTAFQGELPQGLLLLQGDAVFGFLQLPRVDAGSLQQGVGRCHPQAAQGFQDCLGQTDADLQLVINRHGDGPTGILSWKASVTARVRLG